MGFGSSWLESSYSRWRLQATRRLISHLLIIFSIAHLVKALVNAPYAIAAKQALLAIIAMAVHIILLLRKERILLSQIATTILLLLSFLLFLPSYSSVFPALTNIFIIYTFFTYRFFISLTINVFVSIIQISALVLFHDTLSTNELLSIILVHLWCHFISIYLNLQIDRLSRSSFLSSRNSMEAETLAANQSDRLTRLLQTFLPSHLISRARHQITLYSPHIYTEYYSQVTVAYARLIGFEAVLSQCSSSDAARVLKEFDTRINRLAELYGCTRIISEGITVVSSIPNKLCDHPIKVCQFALDLEALIRSFRESTTADVSLSIGIDSGTLTAGIVGNSKWHYDIIGQTIDNCILLQSNAPTSGVFVTDETHQLLGNNFEFERIGEYWKIVSNQNGTEVFPINRRFSLVTVPQAINRLLQTMSSTMKVTTKKRQQPSSDDQLANIDNTNGHSNSSFMNVIDLSFRNDKMEEEYHKEMDHWFIPAITISIFFLVIYGIYHMLVMPRLLISLLIIIIALTIMFSILLMLYINFFHNFTQFITRTPSGHTITVIIILLILLLCGIVNTFSCPQFSVLEEQTSNTSSVCRSIHFSAFSFVLWILTATVFLRFSSLYLLLLLFASILVYSGQIGFNHPPIGPQTFIVEFDILSSLLFVILVVFLRARFCELMMRLDFLAVIKGVEETTTKDQLALLNSQILLNLVPPHVAPWITMKGNELWHHAHHSVGVAYMAVSGFDLEGEDGLNALNFVFSHFDQTLAKYRGIEKIKNANRFYTVAVGMLPDVSQNVNETPWTIGELLNTLAQYLLSITQFASDHEFHVQIGIDCGSTLTIVSDTEYPRYELWGDTVERARRLMQSASHNRMLVSEEIYLALRPRELEFSPQPTKIDANLNAYILYCRGREAADEETVAMTSSLMMPKEEQERHTKNMFEAAIKSDELPSSMASSFSSELQSIDGDVETDSDLEWITPETALMQEKKRIHYQQKQKSAQPQSRDISRDAESSSVQMECQEERRGSTASFRRRYYWETDYDPYRVPVKPARPPEPYYSQPYKAEQAVQYSDWSEQENSRAGSRTSNYRNHRKWKRSSSKTSMRSALSWLRKDSSMDVSETSQWDAKQRLDAASSRVDKMLQELNAYGEYADIKPIVYRPFPTNFTGTVGSIKSLNRALSSACHTEYDNDESDVALSDVECNNNPPNNGSQVTSVSQHQLHRSAGSRNRVSKWRREGTDADAESQCSSQASSIDLRNKRWKSVHSVGYENEYEIVSSSEDEEGDHNDSNRPVRLLAMDEMCALSRDIRANFGDFKLASFDDVER
ncbi:unnamed protein product [Auanema sp. JU1783]|nr:unnamed protein product [Auanema sp. JU1783]